MHDFSGVWYRIWGVCGIILILGVVLILFERPWAKNFGLKKCKLGLVIIAFAICLGLVYVSRIVFPDVSSYTGEFVESHRNSRVAPPFPLTNEYVFWSGEGERQVFYLDIFSKKEIYPHDFISERKYTIYFDEFTNVITRVEPIE